MATPNPMNITYSSLPPIVPSQTYTIAGIRTTVYGLEDLPKEVKSVACLWLLHPRLQTQECMAPIAATTLTEWNNRLQNTKHKGRPTGLIAVSFDQRNHGTREVDNLANEAWRSGNESHAQDMFSIYRESCRHGGTRFTLIIRRRDCRGYITLDGLYIGLCLSCFRPYHNQPHGSRYLLGGSRCLALSASRTSHHQWSGCNWMSRLCSSNV